VSDWLDDLLDRHPGEPVPAGFARRVRARLDGSGREPEWGRTLRPLFRRGAPAAVAALLFLALGFLLGSGGRLPGPSVPDRPAEEAAEASVEEIFRYRDLLEDLDLASDGELELAFQDATARGLIEAAGGGERR
jgi:hypothetical protein